MAILDRFFTVVRSNLNHLIGKAEDPEKMLNQTLLDMQQQLIDAKRQVAMAIADEKRLLKQFDQEKELSEGWEKKAMLAVRAGQDDLAKQALQRQSEHGKMAKGYHEQWNAQKNSVEQLKSALQKLGDKIEEARRKKNLLVARARRAEAQKSITETMSGLSQSSALETMERIEEKINRLEAEAEATTELAHEATQGQLEAEFEKLEIGDSEDALLDLKAKMGLPSGRKALLPPTDLLTKSKLEEIEQEIRAETSKKPF